jgi:hypothetical protein
MDMLQHFRQVWLIDFEFWAPPGQKPMPLCVVACELRTGAKIRCWLADGAPAMPPYDIGPDSLAVAYYSSAEWGCHLALGWPLLPRVLDLFTEFRNLTSGLPVPCGHSLLGAMAFFGLDALSAAEKQDMRALAMRGPPYTIDERDALIDYCEADVNSLARLLPAMVPSIVPSGLDAESQRKSLGQALLRGRFMTAAARIERTAIPIDVVALARLRDNWDEIKARLIAAVNPDYDVFVPINQRSIDPRSQLGAALLETAKEWQIDPHRLADAVDELWLAERAASMELGEAVKAARKATGLTPAQIDKWERSGRDYSTYPGLDVVARELAGTYPELGVGRGYASDAPEEGDQDERLWQRLRESVRLRPKHHPAILRRAAALVMSCPANGGYQSRPVRFSAEKWSAYLTRKGIAWPRLESGALDLSDDAFREQARAHPSEVGPIRALRHALSQLRLNELTVWTDGRNRDLLSAFGSKTGRNQPSNAKSIFGPSCWLRSLIRPEPGRALAYCDWSQQELAIAAALSGDRAMQDAYISGDFYLTFGKMAGSIPAEATKETHGGQRDQFKTIALAQLPQLRL